MSSPSSSPLPSGFRATAALTALENWWDTTTDANQTCSVVGPAGSGKSLAVARFVSGLNDARTVWFGLDTANPDRCLLQAVVELGGTPERDRQGPVTRSELVTLIGELDRRQAAVGQRLVLVVDGLDATLRADGTEDHIADRRIAGLLLETAAGTFPNTRAVTVSQRVPADLSILERHRVLVVDTLDAVSQQALVSKQWPDGGDAEAAALIAASHGSLVSLDVGSRLLGSADVVEAAKLLLVRAAQGSDHFAFLAACVSAEVLDLVEGEAGAAGIVRALAGAPRGLDSWRLSMAASDKTLGSYASPTRTDAALQRLESFGVVTQSLNEWGAWWSMPEELRGTVLAGMDSEHRNNVLRRLAQAVAGREVYDWVASVHPDERSLWMDAAEESIAFYLAAGDVTAAYEIYARKIGGYSVLVSTGTGDFVRGARWCRMIMESPQDGVGAQRLDFRTATAVRDDQGLFLEALGEGHLAAETCGKADRTAIAAPPATLTLLATRAAESNIPTGRLSDAGVWANRSYEHLLHWIAANEGIPTRELIASMDRTFSVWLHAVQLRREVEAAEQILQLWQVNRLNAGKLFGIDDQPSKEELDNGRVHCRMLLGAGDAVAAVSSARRSFESLSRNGLEGRVSMDLRLLCGRGHLMLGDVQEALTQSELVTRWSSMRDAADLTGRAAHLRGLCLLAKDEPADAAAAAAEALRVVEPQGLGIVRIDLMGLQARAALRSGRNEEAAAISARAAWGVVPAQDDDGKRSGGGGNIKDQRVPLYAAHPECGYASGEAECRRIYEQATGGRPGIG